MNGLHINMSADFNDFPNLSHFFLFNKNTRIKFWLNFFSLFFIILIYSSYI